MSRFSLCALSVLMLGALGWAPANAAACLKDQKPYHLAGDSIGYSMTIAPGADCIQGLRWSTMQIYAVWILEKPRGGEIVIEGSGFRYFANPGFSGPDKFSLLVIGKNRRDEGYSTVDIAVARSESPLKLSATSEPMVASDQ